MGGSGRSCPSRARRSSSACSRSPASRSSPASTRRTRSSPAAYDRFPVLFWIGLFAAAVLTAFYMARLFIMTFLGKPQGRARPRARARGPLVDDRAARDPAPVLATVAGDPRLARDAARPDALRQPRIARAPHRRRPRTASSTTPSDGAAAGAGRRHRRPRARLGRLLGHGRGAPARAQASLPRRSSTPSRTSSSSTSSTRGRCSVRRTPSRRGCALVRHATASTAS